MNEKQADQIISELRRIADYLNSIMVAAETLARLRG
jgi:hypothetical protein